MSAQNRRGGVGVVITRSDDPAFRGCFKLLTGSGKGTTVRIGRAPNNHIVVTLAGVSAYHAEVQLLDSNNADAAAGGSDALAFQVRDVSTNGTGISETGPPSTGQEPTRMLSQHEVAAIPSGAALQLPAKLKKTAETDHRVWLTVHLDKSDDANDTTSDKPHATSKQVEAGKGQVRRNISPASVGSSNGAEKARSADSDSDAVDKPHAKSPSKRRSSSKNSSTQSRKKRRKAKSRKRGKRRRRKDASRSRSQAAEKKRGGKKRRKHSRSRSDASGQSKGDTAKAGATGAADSAPPVLMPGQWGRNISMLQQQASAYPWANVTAGGYPFRPPPTGWPTPASSVQSGGGTNPPPPSWPPPPPAMSVPGGQPTTWQQPGVAAWGQWGAVPGAPGAPSPLSTSEAQCKEQIRFMYQRFKPEKLVELDTIFAKYKGRESDLLQAMCDKYLGGQKPT